VGITPQEVNAPVIGRILRNLSKAAALLPKSQRCGIKAAQQARVRAFVIGRQAVKGFALRMIFALS